MPLKKKAKKKTVKMSTPMQEDHVLIIRTCSADMTSYNGFKWPEKGEVSCPDWDPKPRCGDGLHGLAWGEGAWNLLSSDPSAKWQVVKVKAADIVKIDDSTAASSGNSSTAASSGDSSTAASSGNYSTAASSGDYSTAASSGDSSKAASSGNYSTAASSGNYSTAASSGNYSTAASSGYYSTAASSGKDTIAMAVGSGCRVKAGENGCFATAYWDEQLKRYRILVGYVGEDGIKADTWYVIKGGKFVEDK